MIDTDKYEGHTPAPWKAIGNGEIEAHYSIAQVLPFVSPKAFDATANLIADAPLLLAEIKRLRDIVCLLEDSRIRGLSIFDRPQLFDDVLQVHTQRNEQGNGDLPCWTLFEGFGDEE